MWHGYIVLHIIPTKSLVNHKFKFLTAFSNPPQPLLHHLIGYLLGVEGGKLTEPLCKRFTRTHFFMNYPPLRFVFNRIWPYFKSVVMDIYWITQTFYNGINYLLCTLGGREGMFGKV